MAMEPTEIKQNDFIQEIAVLSIEKRKLQILAHSLEKSLQDLGIELSNYKDEQRKLDNTVIKQGNEIERLEGLCKRKKIKYKKEDLVE